jgi:hypothetical protein
MAVIGNKAPTTVTINEMTTVASVWTHAQFLDGSAIKGPALSLRIAAGNVPNFVDLQSGGWGTTIQDPLNSGQTPTMANFATLADVIAGCVTSATADACPKLYTASTPPKGDAPNDTLMAAQSIARAPWYQPTRVFALLDQFYPVPEGKLRPVPYMPYLNFAQRLLIGLGSRRRSASQAIDLPADGGVTLGSLITLAGFDGYRFSSKHGLIEQYFAASDACIRGDDAAERKLDEVALHQFGRRYGFPCAVAADRCA